MTKNKKLIIEGIEITVISQKKDDYICITDMAKARKGDARAADVIKNWIRTRTTLEFLGTWEQLNNPDFKVVEFDHFKMQAGLPSFVLSTSQWVDKTNAIGIYMKAGKYGGTYAHIDIALEFGSAISPVFKIYLIREYKRLKNEEKNRLKLDWNLQRTLSKVNYRIHTDAIKETLIPPQLNKNQINLVYASEADILNMALFGKTAKQWRAENPDAKGLTTRRAGNIRDEATLEQLVVLSNLESINAVLVRQEMSQIERLQQLNAIAIIQMTSLLNYTNLKKLKR